MKFRLYLQTKKPRNMGFGVLAGDAHNMQFLFDDKIIAELNEPELIFMNSHGIRFCGFEHSGYEKDGQKKFRYMEWWCVFEEGYHGE